KIYICNRCGKYKVTGRGQAISKEYFKGLNYILSGIARNLTEDRLEPLLITSTDPKELIKKYDIPKTIEDKIYLIIKYLKRKSDHFGQLVQMQDSLDFPVAYCANSLELKSILDTMVDWQYIKSIGETNTSVYLLWQGWDIGEELLQSNLSANKIKDGFKDKVLNKKDFEYDVALSFAGENRNYVSEVAKELKKREIKYFYDNENKVKLWGKNLTEYLHDLYKDKARFCVMFISIYYKEKMWTKHERRSALERAIQQNDEYILPVRFDESDIPGLNSTIHFIDATKISPKDIAELIELKIGNEPVKIANKTSNKTITERDLLLHEALKISDKTKRLTIKEEYLKSRKAFDDANKEVDLMYDEFEKIVNEANGDIIPKTFIFQREKSVDNRIIIFSQGYSLLFRWTTIYVNSLTSSSLYVNLYQGYLSLENINQAITEVKELYECIYFYDYSIEENLPAWKLSDSSNLFTSFKLVEAWFRTLIQYINKQF
ncbi:MAG TPA: TIR domain-containing protein, partial [Ignavibacteria bacterium]